MLLIKRTKRRRYRSRIRNSYTANHYALPMCQANLLNIAWTRCQGVSCKARIGRAINKDIFVGEKHIYIVLVLFLGSPLSTTQGVNMDKKDKEIEALKDTIWQIADIIYMQLPLRYQDKWLEIMIERGLYDGHIED